MTKKICKGCGEYVGIYAKEYCITCYNRHRCRNLSKKQKEKNQQKKKEYYYKNREKMLKSRKNYYYQNKKKLLVNIQDYQKYKRGEIIKDKCELCRSTEKLELHHETYHKSNNEIKILCIKCHRNLHRIKDKR